LDFAGIRRELSGRQQKRRKDLRDLSDPFLGRPLGTMLGSSKTNLASFLAFSQGHLSNLTRRAFAEYLKELKDTAPEGAWIKGWTIVDPDQPEEASGKFRKLYDLWRNNSSADQPNLTVPVKIGDMPGETNYFWATWRRLKEMEPELGRWSQAQERLDELDHAYVALCIVDAVDPKQPRPGLEMIRFGP
jgi:hypothetical protein